MAFSFQNFHPKGIWILPRIFEKKYRNNHSYIFNATVNWMRALSIIIEQSDYLDDENLLSHYKSVERRAINRESDASVFKSMIMAFHNYAALYRFQKEIEHPRDICISSIVSWYYSIYFTCKAMNSATLGQDQETHRGVARDWHSLLLKRDFILPPFSLNLSCIAKNHAEEEIDRYHCKYINNVEYSDHKMIAEPKDIEDAWCTAISYLKGTLRYERKRIKRDIKSCSEFKNLKVNNFIKKEARELRDRRFNNGKNVVNFLTQAIRYRGKANYRDSIFLVFGFQGPESINRFIKDLTFVSRAFQRMASYYLSRRIEKGAWPKFVEDLGLSLEPSSGVSHLKVP